MPYTTTADLLARDSATDLANLTGGTDTAYVQAAIDAVIATAQSVVDSYIAGRVHLPLADGEVSESIKRQTAVVARYYLYGDQKTEAVVAEYEEAMKWLRDVSGGRASCGVVQAADPSATVTGSAIVAPMRKPTFGTAFEKLYGVRMGANGSGGY